MCNLIKYPEYVLVRGLSGAQLRLFIHIHTPLLNGVLKLDFLVATKMLFYLPNLLYNVILYNKITNRNRFSQEITVATENPSLTCHLVHFADIAIYESNIYLVNTSTDIKNR